MKNKEKNKFHLSSFSSSSFVFSSPFDLRFGVRVLLKKPFFTVIAIAMLALGIGATTAIFSVVQAVLLRPLPFAEQERLAVIWKSDAATNHPFVEVSIPEFNDWRSQTQVFEHLAAMTTTVQGYDFALTGRGEPVQLQSARVTADFFQTLGVRPALGRAFTADEDRVGMGGTVIISHRLWQSRFNSAPDLVGQTISLDGGSFTVIGVMPAEFQFPNGVDLWAPLAATSDKSIVDDRQYGFLQIVGRLKPSVTRKQAQAELDTIIRRIAVEHPETKASGHHAVITPLATYLTGDAQTALYLLLAATALLLLIACANISNLLLARATARRKEMAVRFALGATRGRIVRQLMIESLLLAITGGGLGVLLALWLIDPLTKLAPMDIPRIEAVQINAMVLLFTCGLTLLAAFVCGLAPALIASKININEALIAGSRVGGERRGDRMRNALVVAEIAITLMLLIGSGLISRSFLNLRRVDFGFNPDHVLTFQLRLHGPKYREIEKSRDFFRELIERLEAQPGVVAAGAVLLRPLEGIVGWDVGYLTDGQSEDEIRRNAVLNCESVTPHYFRSMGIPLKAGREFTEQDNEHAPQVAIITETMARRIFAPGVDAVGKRIKLGGQGWRTIIGVAGDARYRGLRDMRWDVYVPYMQFPIPVLYVTVRTTSDPTSFIAVARREVAALGPDQAITGLTTMEQLVSAALARPRFNALLLNLLSALAGILAVMGIYGVVSYSVTQRTQEIGIRLALGAQAGDVLRLIIGRGMALAIGGVGSGIAASLALTWLMQGLLFGVSAIDPLTFAVTALPLAAVALLACYIPARRAAKVDPLIALRED